MRKIVLMILLGITLSGCAGMFECSMGAGIATKDKEQKEK